MTLFLAFAVVLELCVFLYYDFRLCRGRMNERYIIRVISALPGILLIVSDSLIPPFELKELLVDLSVSSLILMLYPCSFEKPDLSLKTSVLTTVLSVSFFALFSFVPQSHTATIYSRLIWTCTSCILIFVGYFISVAIRRFSILRMFFRSSAAWETVEDFSRFLYSIFYLALSVVGLCSLLAPGDSGVTMAIISILLHMILYAVLFLRASTGHTFVIGRDTEKRIQEIIRGNLRISIMERVEADRKMDNLYKRVMMFMDEKKPYLDPAFDMKTLSERMYSNKLYLSKTINLLSGRNFRQFINYHRVQYAISLFKADPKLKVGEVSEMSGFNSSVSFNMAFKVNTGKTPREWIQDYFVENH